MVEKLLKFFIAEIDAKLFKTIELKDFETGNIQYSDEANPETEVGRNILEKLM